MYAYSISFLLCSGFSCPHQGKKKRGGRLQNWDTACLSAFATWKPKCNPVSFVTCQVAVGTILWFNRNLITASSNLQGLSKGLGMSTPLLWSSGQTLINSLGREFRYVVAARPAMLWAHTIMQIWHLGKKKKVKVFAKWDIVYANWNVVQKHLVCCPVWAPKVLKQPGIKIAVK